MKAKIVSMLIGWTAQTACCQGVQFPDAITFTNRAGDVVANAHVFAHTASEVFYELPGGGARVKLAELPLSIQRDFHFDPAAAAAKDRLDAAKREAAAARIAEQKQLSAGQIVKSRESDAVGKTAVTLSGRIFQVTDGGALVQYNHYVEQIGDTGYDRYGAMGFIQGCDRSQLSDGAPFPATTLYPIGSYSYNTVGGSVRTVTRYTTSLASAVEWHSYYPGLGY